MMFNMVCVGCGEDDWEYIEEDVFTGDEYYECNWYGNVVYY